ncbi:MAG: hypothetical protein AB7S70_05890 [Hyphomicrobium sp.]|uniref:hypothetical protein n=1 Tax=Hyphomicrobium sp. TaxID=82 RepID=UPI003D11DBA7
MLKRGAALLTVLLLTSAQGAAQTPAAEKNAPPNAGAKEAADAPAVPNNYTLELLIRTTIIAVNQANATGNYSVLRDLSAPSFQSANDQARLAEIFAALRARKLDLSPILVFTPKLVQPPAIGKDGRLRLTGFFDTRPERVVFDLLFEKVESKWRLFGVALDVAAPGANAKQAGDEASKDKDGTSKEAADSAVAKKAAKKDTKN